MKSLHLLGGMLLAAAMAVGFSPHALAAESPVSTNSYTLDVNSDFAGLNAGVFQDDSFLVINVADSAMPDICMIGGDPPSGGDSGGDPPADPPVGDPPPSGGDPAPGYCLTHLRL